jgi:hypothetical protein
MQSRTYLAVFSAVSVLLALDACRTTDGVSDVAEDPIATRDDAGARANSVCSAACADTTSTENWAVCWSCKCKEAMDGWLPSPAEIGCAAGKEMEIFTMKEGADGSPEMTKVTGAVDKCLNPDRLRNHCEPGSRLVQVQHGDIMGKAICKREAVIENYADPNVTFSETGIILHNNRTGATCFYDDYDNVVSGDKQPDIDLTSGDPAKVAAFVKTYYRHEGEGCVACHDNDPFMYSPHLSTTGWMKPNGYQFGPYHLVNTKNLPPKSLHKQLVSPEAAPCTSCHRISDGWGTCNQWVKDAVGTPSIATMQEWMHRDSGKWGVKVDPRGFKWSYPFWMPDYNYIGATMQPPPDAKSWDDRFGEARDHILKCCATPQAPGCVWEDIPPT